MSSTVVVGIDLGTTNTCVACYTNDRVKILENEEGGRVTPSYIFTTEKDNIIVGSSAKLMARTKPENAIYEIKRLIGRKFDDPYVQNNLEYFSFDIANKNNEAVVAIERKNSQFTASPVQLCTAILRKIKTDAEAKIGESIDKAVITVPAYFNNSQRAATLSAANQAGFTVLKLLNEPTAAALSYYREHETEQNYLLVYDLGGGTFDVAILKKNKNDIGIIGVDGNTHLGGNDFDNLIIDYVSNHLKNKYKYDAKSNRRDLRRLRNACEEAKKVLSSAEQTVIVLDGFVKNVATVEVNLTRGQFEEMAKNLFQATINIVDSCLKSCRLAKTDIKEIILSGGSTRVPKIQSMISAYFNGKNVNKVVNPDECVAEGAALQAAMFSKNAKQRIQCFKLADVTPLSLGICAFGDLMNFLIQRNTRIPVSRTITVVTVYDQQKKVDLEVYEGERTNSKKNRHLGTVTINDLTPLPPRQCEILITMSIDKNGILKITAKEKLRNNVKDLIIAYTRGHVSDKEVKNSLQDAKDNKLEDERFVKFASLKEFVVNYCVAAKYNFEKKGLKIMHQDLYKLCTETAEMAKVMDLKDEKELNRLKDVITNKCHKVADMCNFEFMPASYYTSISWNLEALTI